MSSPILEVDGLHVRYGAIAALSDVRLGLAPGTVTTVLGANGAGKSTLLRAVSGLIKPSAGSVTLDGRTLRGLRIEEIARAGLAHVMEGDSVFTDMTVEENLRLGGIVTSRDRSRSARRRRLDEVYGLFPALDPRKRDRAAALSGGERRMLVLGRALMGDPQVLLLDEPSLGLAPPVAAHLLSILRRLCDETGLTVLLAEQNARSALSVADRAVIFNLGHIVIDADATEVALNTDLMTRLRKAYLGF